MKQTITFEGKFHSVEVNKMKKTTLLLAFIFVLAVTVPAQTTPEKLLTHAEAEAVVEEAARGIMDVTGDEALLDAIAEKWEAQEIEGKTRAQILRLLFADVQAVIKDPAIRTKIWRAWNPPAPVTTAPKPAATPGAVQNPQGLSQQEAFQLVSFLKMYVDDLMAANRVPHAHIKWTDSNAFAGKTRAEIVRVLFADVQAVIKDPASRKIIWDRWNPTAPPPCVPQSQKLSVTRIVRS